MEEENKKHPIDLYQLALQYNVFQSFDKQAEKEIEALKVKLNQRKSTLKIGVLALQGDFREHMDMLKKYPGLVEAIQVKKPEHLQAIDGLIIPGGESTTFGILAVRFGLMQPLKEFVKHKAVWGTCAGMIMLCNQHSGIKMGKDLKVLSQLQVEMRESGKKKTIYVAVQQDNKLASSFHPQITGQADFYNYFLTKVIKYLSTTP